LPETSFVSPVATVLPLLETLHLDPARMPRHVAIIMDGNGRWARQRGNLRVFGHKSAIEAVRDTVEGAAELGIQYLTLYAFSTENWSRPPTEVKALMDLLVTTISKEVPTLLKNDIRLNNIGRQSDLPARCRRSLAEAIAATSHCRHMTLTLALSYGSRADIVEAARALVAKAAAGQLHPEDVNEKMLASHLSTANLPDPELIIRTSGEQRISNFLMWEGAYAEIYFTSKLWPDFRRQDLQDALYDFQGRERRFGKTSEQLQAQA
jgi:undecaprenyl diphosphate synthase